MDYTVLYIIGIILISLCLGYGLSFFMKKYNITKDKITEGIDVTKGVTMFIKLTLKDMNFGNKDTIEKATEILNKSLDYLKTLQNVESKDEKLKLTTAYCIEVCTKQGVILNEDRIYILNTIIAASYNMLYSIEEKI